MNVPLSTAELSQFLQRIPQSNQDEAALNTLLSSGAASEALAAAHGYALLLHTLGVVDYDAAAQTIRARSQTAKYALNSLAAYVEADLRIIDDWKTRGAEEDNILRNGASFLRALDARRFALNPQAEPSRRERVAQVLIKRQNPQTGEPELFFQYDKNAGQYQLVGGRWSPRDGDDMLKTMIREIEEELPLNTLNYGQDYGLTLLAADLVPPVTLSPTFGALTEYHFHIYHLTDLEQPLTLGQHDRWVSIAQVKDGAIIGDDGETVPFSARDIYAAIEAVIPGGFEKLASSFRQ